MSLLNSVHKFADFINVSRSCVYMFLTTLVGRGKSYLFVCLATQAFKAHYADRAGIEETLSQGLRAFNFHRSRYMGLARTITSYLITGGDHAGCSS